MTDATEEASPVDEGLLLLETINPLDLTPDDLVDMGKAIREVTDVPVGVAYFEQHGAGVTWYEVLRLWLPSEEFFRDSTWTFVLGIAFEKMWKRFDRPGGERRPKHIVVHDPSGKVVATFVIANRDAEPVEQANDDGQPPRRRPPLKRRVG